MLEPGGALDHAQTRPGAGRGADGPAKADANSESKGVTGAEGAQAGPEVPDFLNQKNVSSFMKARFKSDVQAQGNFEDFFELNTSVKVQDKRPKGITPDAGLDAFWGRVAARLNGYTGDERDFGAVGYVETKVPAKRGKPESTAVVRISVGLTRRAVTKKENADIQKGLVKCNPAHCRGGVEKLAPETYEAFKNFYSSIPAEFLQNDPDYGKITSGFRSVDEQEKAFARKLESVKAKNPGISEAAAEKEARTWVAKPGTSAHNTGHGIDIWMGWSNSSANAKAMTSGKGKLHQKHGKFYAWCKENAPKHGFLPYSAEPWHWERWK